MGWFGIGLGVLELVAPRALSRALGMKHRAPLVGGYGVREIANGVAILAADDPTPWMWARVSGDAVDIATLAGGIAGPRRRRGNAAIALAAVAGVTALDLVCALALSSAGRAPKVSHDTSIRSGTPRAMREGMRTADEMQHYPAR
ncbi:MAG: hypothetical protein ACREF1_00325 [Acetobacteraceae bacterium]